MMLTRKGFRKSLAGAAVATGLFNGLTLPLAYAQEVAHILADFVSISTGSPHAVNW